MILPPSSGQPQLPPRAGLERAPSESECAGAGAYGCGLDTALWMGGGVHTGALGRVCRGVCGLMHPTGDGTSCR